MTSETSQRFFERFSQIPLVSISIQKATDLYSTTKSSNQLFESTFNMAENLTKFATDAAQPILKVMDGPIVVTNKLACQQLTKLEDNYPIMLSTPEEIFNKSKEYFDKSTLKSKIDLTKEVKDAALSKVKEASVDSKAKITYFLDQSFSFANAVVDTYFAVPQFDDIATPSTSKDSNEGPYLSQFYNMTIKVSDGMRQRYIAPNVERARESMKLLPHLAILTSNADSVNRITDVLHQVQEKSSVYQTNSEEVLLNLVHRVASSSNIILERMFILLTPYVPDKMENHVKGLVFYVRGFNNDLTNTQSLGEVTQKSLEEMKNGVYYVLTLANSWLVGSKTDGAAMKTQKFD